MTAGACRQRAGSARCLGQRARLLARSLTGFLHGRRRAGPGGPGGPEAGQALLVVIGVVGLLSAGTVALSQNAVTHQTMITQSAMQHEAYQAMVSGVNEYLAAANTNPDFVTCTSADDSDGFCADAVPLATWVPVPGAKANDTMGAWFWLQQPTIDYANASVSVTVVGASGSGGQYAYDQGTATFDATNDFLLNVLWIDYNQTDPVVLQQIDNLSTAPVCDLWQPAAPGKAADSLGPSPYCSDIDFVTGDTLDGSIWVKDAIFVCGTPHFDIVHTMDSNPPPGQFTEAGTGCAGENTPVISDPSASTAGSATPDESIPNTNNSLASTASAAGCLYEGPTEITLTGTTMEVDSPDTPTAGGSGTGPNDSLDASGNPNQCLPTTADPNPKLPSNGVIYVEDCPASNFGCSESGAFDPMAGLGETGNSGPSYGDAIVQGTVGAPLTIATANNIVVDGNICYLNNPCGSAPPTTSTEVLGLIAQNFVEINHPNRAPSCGSGWSSAPDCTLQNPTVDAVILAMNGSFIVNNYNQGSPLGTLTVVGAIGQQWRGPVGTISGNSPATGYLKDYIYDNRLQVLSPPYYLNPGTASWGLGGITLQPTARCQPAGCGPP